MENNPRKLFQRLFGRGDTPDERKQLISQYSSYLVRLPHVELAFYTLRVRIKSAVKTAFGMSQFA